jgi:voltage-gated potassium channel
VTVTTVGYGDFFPITTAGRITAVVVMTSGVITLAVITANVASSFFGSSGSSPAPEVTLDDLDRRLARIEALIADRLGGSATAAPTSDSDGDGDKA